MILNQPTKKILFRFENLSGANKENIKAFILGLKKEYDFVLYANDDEFMLVSDELNTLCDVYDKSFVYFMKKDYKFETMFKCVWNIKTEEEALGFLDNFFNKPTDEEYMCLETSFIYGRDGVYMLVEMGITGEHQVTISIMDSVETSDNIRTKYDDAVIAMHKIIKY